MDDHHVDADTEDEELGPPKPKSLLLRVAIVVGMLATATAALLGPLAPPAPQTHAAAPAQK